MSSDAPNKTRASAGYYRMMGEAAKAVSGEVFRQLSEAISDALSEMNPAPDLMVGVMKTKYYAGLRGEVDRLLAQPPAKVHAVYAQLQPALHDRSTEIRSYYQSVGETRFSTEIYKADWDYFRDGVVKGAIIGFDVVKLNWHKIKDHLKALEKLNKITDGAYTTTNLALEIYRYHFLWCDARSSFDFVNRSIDQGNLAASMIIPDPGFNLFNAAFAGNIQPLSSDLGVQGISGLDFSLRGGQFPVTNINKAIEAGKTYKQWIQSNSIQRDYLTGFSPQVAGALYKAAYDFENDLVTLMINVLVYAEEKSDANRKNYASSADVLKKSAAAFSESGGKAKAEMDNMPDRIPVPVMSINRTGGTIWGNPFYQKIGAGILALAFISLVTILLIHRSRRKNAICSVPGQSAEFRRSQIPDAKVPQPHAPEPTMIVAPPVVPEPPKAKFCGKCGNQLKPGATFCGKCGNRV